MSHQTYIQALGKGFPGVYAKATGAGEVYEEIVWEGGAPLPDKATLDAWMLQDEKDEMWELIKKERDRRKTDGGYKVGNYWFHSDDTSRIQQIALVMLGANMPANIMWKTMSGDFVLMTPTLAGQIFQAAMVSDTTIFTIAEQKKAAMLASADPLTYSWSTGWPLIYGE